MRITKSLLLAAATTAAAMTLAPPLTVSAQTATAATPAARTQTNAQPAQPSAASKGATGDGVIPIPGKGYPIGETEEQRKARLAREAEEARRAEEARKAEEARRAEEARKKKEEEEQRRNSYIASNAYIGFGPAYYRASWKDGGDATNCYGLAVYGGVTLWHTSVGQIRLGGDMGTYFGSKKKDDYGESEKYNSSGFDVMFTPAYEFNLGAPNYRLRLGPVFGAAVLMQENKYDDWTYKGTGASFSYGLETGFTWTPSKSFFVDLGYRYTRNSAKMGGDFNDYKLKWDGHRVALSVGWRF